MSARMQAEPRSERVHIGVFGRCNVGKSSLINALTQQSVSLVSDTPGTTTDPVYKSMELHGLGPVVFVDTAGLDESSKLGALRRRRTQQALETVDMLLVVAALPEGFGDCEKAAAAEAEARQIPIVYVLNKADIGEPPNAAGSPPALEPLFVVSAASGQGIDTLREGLQQRIQRDQEPPLVGDLLGPADLVLLVAPIDAEAPQGRLILPQVQVLRDILDHRASAIVCQPEEVAQTLANLRQPPSLVVTDSQAFREVREVVPEAVPLTSFSILMARRKGDLNLFRQGLQALAGLRPGARVLISEACSHHPVGEDIGRVKIPRWLQERIGPLQIEFANGKDYPEDLEEYALVVHCGGCMLTRRQMLNRLAAASQPGVPIVNYGMLIAYLHGVFPRALEMF